ncbi:MAG: hypothetical protein CMQ05_07460 [Gammaproteobacteria bacterium]|uniref:Uncharacterized protein n=1 Tax=OM182 bacterium MED-G24 TaxID=1986255 RepID=A0A2A5X0F6_9GAMM|nr:hypothetical protein [Gammaproteobacteria bacterium]PDH41937.1 MAG: hypothetical protein CNE99_00990 [OM182 bacterium MED-G24]
MLLAIALIITSVIIGVPFLAPELLWSSSVDSNDSVRDRLAHSVTTDASSDTKEESQTTVTSDGGVTITDTKDEDAERLFAIPSTDLADQADVRIQPRPRTIRIPTLCSMESRMIFMPDASMYAGIRFFPIMSTAIQPLSAFLCAANIARPGVAKSACSKSSRVQITSTASGFSVESRHLNWKSPIFLTAK